MKSFLIIGLVAMLAGCDMTRLETIAAVKECNQGGMDSRIVKHGFGRAVYCIMRKQVADVEGKNPCGVREWMLK